ncbi:MAG: hypothetical protein ACHP7D_10800 [Lysobacterales bacterium]
MTFIAELKRRNVIRMAGLYLVGAWLFTQVAGTVLPMFDAPAWLPRSIVILLAIGFVPALAFAWVFELTPTGLRRDVEVHPQESIAPQTARRMDRAIIAVLALALGYFAFDKFALAPRRESALATAAEQRAAPESVETHNGKSIAVLPFENLSADKDNAYFATGMQDEILTRLAGIHDLKVISRTSTEQYASRPPNLKVVAEQLGVATVLEGSVQKADGKVRINLQLIDAHSDSHLWAQNYDRDLKDVFAVQSDVAEKVADALQAQLLPAESARIASVPTQNQQAYDLFLKGQYLYNQLRTSSTRDPVAVGKQATDLYHRAVAADPGFALAYASQSYLQSYLHWYGVDSSPATVEAAGNAASKALELQPDLPEAHLAMGYVHYWCHRDYAAALDEFAIARAGLPNNAEVVAAIGYVHRRQGIPDRGIPELQQASVLDPRNSLLPREMANSFVAIRRYADADAAYARSLAIFPADIEAQVQRATSMMFSGNLPAAERTLAAIPADMDPQASVSLLRFKLAMIQRKPDAALAVIAHAPDWLMTRWEHSVAPLGLLRGQALAAKGETGPAHAAFAQAEQALQDMLKNPETAVDALSYLGLVHAGLGEKEAALTAAGAAAEQLPMSRDVIVGAFQLERLARVEAQVGEIRSAIDHLQQLMDSAGGETVSVATLRIDPVWDLLRRDPRFRKLIADGEAGQAKITP